MQIMNSQRGRVAIAEAKEAQKLPNFVFERTDMAMAKSQDQQV